MLATVTAASIKKVQIKKYSVFIYSEAEPHAMYAIYKQTRKLCVLQYLTWPIWHDKTLRLPEIKIIEGALCERGSRSIGLNLGSIT